MSTGRIGSALQTTMTLCVALEHLARICRGKRFFNTLFELARDKLASQVEIPGRIRSLLARLPRRKRGSTGRV
jgi:hypothetical protein